MSTKNSTTRRGRPNQHTGKLKVMLLSGSVIATLAGMQLLPAQDGTTTEATESSTEAVIVVVPVQEGASFELPPGERRTAIELNPIPQVVQPDIRPVARTRSS